MAYGLWLMAYGLLKIIALISVYNLKRFNNHQIFLDPLITVLTFNQLEF